MSTLHDLRETLEQHADGVVDHDLHARPLAVRSRIRAARRRRTTALAAAVAVVAVGAVATVGTLRDPAALEPAGPTGERVLGIDVPGTWSLNEFPYELERTESFRGPRNEITLGGEEDGPERAVALLASGLGSGTATLFRDGEPIARARGAQDVTVPVPVATGETTLTLRLGGTPEGARTAIAVYTATDELPEGLSNGTAVFRQVVAGAELLGGQFAAQEADADPVQAIFAFTGRLDEARFARYCTSPEPDVRFNLEVDGGGAVSGPCGGTDSRDAGTTWMSLDGPGSEREHQVRAYLTRGDSDEPVAVPGAELGAAVYRQPEAARTVAGANVEAVVEYAGRTWRLDRVEDHTTTRVAAGTSDVLVGFVAQGTMVRGTWRGSLTEGASDHVTSRDRPISTLGGVALRGDTYDVRLTAEEGEARGAILVYRPTW